MSEQVQEQESELTSVERAVLTLKHAHHKTWRDKSQAYWLAMLMGEVGELAGSLYQEHDDLPEWELMQIAAICLNWLEYRQRRLIAHAIDKSIVRSDSIKQSRDELESVGWHDVCAQMLKFHGVEKAQGQDER